MFTNENPSVTTFSFKKQDPWKSRWDESTKKIFSSALYVIILFVALALANFTYPVANSMFNFIEDSTEHNLLFLALFILLGAGPAILIYRFGDKTIKRWEKEEFDWRESKVDAIITILRTTNLFDDRNIFNAAGNLANSSFCRVHDESGNTYTLQVDSTEFDNQLTLINHGEYKKKRESTTQDSIQSAYNNWRKSAKNEVTLEDAFKAGAKLNN